MKLIDYIVEELLELSSLEETLFPTGVWLNERRLSGLPTEYKLTRVREIAAPGSASLTKRSSDGCALPSPDLDFNSHNSRELHRGYFKTRLSY